MNEAVLDATAILALLQNEAGAEKVTAILSHAAVSAVNFAEVIGKLTDFGMPEEVIRTAVGTLELEIIPFDEELGYRTGLLRGSTSRFGLSLGDRACLALGLHLTRPVFTADRAWAALKVGVEIHLIR